MTAADHNEPSSAENTAYFFPPSLESVKRQGKKLRKFLGKDSLKLSNAYDLTARIFGYRSYWAIRQAILSNSVRTTIWDHELSEPQLRERRRVQAQVLVIETQISEDDALKILDSGRFSARNINTVVEQSLACAVVNSDQSPRTTPMVVRDTFFGVTADTQISQVKVVYRKRRLVQATV